MKKIVLFCGIFSISFQVGALELRWDKNSASEVDGYRIFTHPLPKDTPTEAVKFGQDVLNTSKNAKKVGGKQMMFVKFTDAQIKQINPDAGVCFRLKAFNTIGKSGFSSAVCTSKKKTAPPKPTGLTIINDVQ